MRDLETTKGKAGGMWGSSLLSGSFPLVLSVGFPGVKLEEPCAGLVPGHGSKKKKRIKQKTLTMGGRIKGENGLQKNALG